MVRSGTVSSLKPVISNFDFPFLPVILISLAFTILLLTLSPGFWQTIKNIGFFPSNRRENIFCGGIAAVACPNGYSCRLDGNYPDAGGQCYPNP